MSAEVHDDSASVPVAAVVTSGTGASHEEGDDDEIDLGFEKKEATSNSVGTTDDASKSETKNGGEEVKEGRKEDTDASNKLSNRSLRLGLPVKNKDGNILSRLTLKKEASSGGGVGNGNISNSGNSTNGLGIKEKRQARAEKFGTLKRNLSDSSLPTTPNEKKRKREERFGPVNAVTGADKQAGADGTVDSETLEKRKQRRKKFSLDDPSSAGTGASGATKSSDAADRKEALRRLGFPQKDEKKSDK